MIHDLKQYLEFRFQKEKIIYHQLPERAGEKCPFPDDLHPQLKNFLLSQKIENLYSHQLEAYHSIMQNQDTVIVAKTAAGKTLSFLLPIMQDYLRPASKENPFSVLLLYPTKALSRDQESTLARLLHFVQQHDEEKLTFGTFDGDTPVEERGKLSERAHFLMTNPDMLHAGILPNHMRKWKNFLSRLKYIVIDEVHTYRGNFGSHVAHVLKRLLRVCELHGSYPTFISLSATIHNPREFVSRLIDRPVHVIEKQGAPQARRHFFFVNPSMEENQQGNLYRKGTGSVTVALLRYAVEKNIRTICFCHSRQQVERLYRAVMSTGHRSLMNKIKPYRGGLLPSERRQLERDLFSGKITAIISTSALELGIDIGDLDLCLLSGYPGSMSSLWQQAGRVGRKGREAAVVFVAKESPLDQYFIRHPDFLWEGAVESAWINPENPYIYLQHLPCAAQEKAISAEENYFNQDLLKESLEILEDSGQLVSYRDSYRYVGHHYPSRGVNLRGMTDFNVEIYLGREVIGEIDPIGARDTLYKDAIYHHLGEKFISMELDLEKKLARVEKVEVNYYTEAVWESRLSLIEEEETKYFHQGKLAFGPVHVHQQPKLYKKIQEGSLENIGYGPITLEPFEYETMGFCLFPPKMWEEAMKKCDKRLVSAAFFGLRYLFKQMGPQFALADKKDIATDVSLWQLLEGEEWECALYLYDTHPGGVGYAEKIYENFLMVIEFSNKVMNDCLCQMGCPACTPSLPPDSDLAPHEMRDYFMESNAVREATKSLLRALLTGEVLLPQIEQVKKSYAADFSTGQTPDWEKLKLQQKLKRASRLLKEKQDQLH